MLDEALIRRGGEAESWFHELTGFAERSAEEVRENLVIEGEMLTSRVNGRTMACGRLETPSLAELRERARSVASGGGRISVREEIADVRELHLDPANAGALFQVASQFNLLEMASPDLTPEDGVGIYENDPTQGPACAVAAGAGTIYRNYFAPTRGGVGQAADDQIDCLADLGEALGNDAGRLWEMRNGYALATAGGLREIAARLAGAAEIDELRRLLRIGIQWNTQVTLRGCAHRVSQAYCAALPVAYRDHAAALWEGFATLVLEGAYESTLHAAVLNSHESGSRRVFLTLLGGGAFGNDPGWICESMRRALKACEDRDLDVAVVSRGRSNALVREIVAEFRC